MTLPRRGATAAVAAAAVLLTGCTGGDGDAVQVATVGRSTVTEVVEAPATVEARATSTLSSPATGTVRKVYVRDGERVAAGTLLVRISSPETTAQLTQARAQLAQVGSPSAPAYIPTGTGVESTTAFATAREAAGRIPDPRAKAVALAQIESAARQYAAAAAQARAAVAAINSGIGSLSAALASLTAAQRTQAQTAVGIAEQAVEALDVRAPIDGTVQLGGRAATASQGTTGLDSVVGQLPAGIQDQAAAALGGGTDTASTTGPVTAGMPVTSGTVLATVVDTSVLSLVAEVDETDVFLVRPGVRAQVELDAVPGARYAATVATVELTPTQSARGGVAYRARLALGDGTLAGGEEAAPRPRPGMSAVADLQVRTAKDAISVPAAALVRDGGRDAVWVVSGDRARRRLVTVGTQGEDEIAITGGLREGERVVVRGADTVREGQELR
ncbi:MAG TPA: efflux RND transporter periplasmic adaptor subunit [Mycobacteriales bacterium]